MRENRSKEILEAFTKQPDLTQSVKELSTKTGISERQIKNYIRQINGQTAPKPIIQSVDSGLFKLCDNYQELLSAFQQSEYLPKERISIILSRLLLSKISLNIYDLAEELYASRPTIESDLKRIKKMITPFDVTVSVSNDHITISGSEKSLQSSHKLYDY